MSIRTFLETKETDGAYEDTEIRIEASPSKASARIVFERIGVSEDDARYFEVHIDSEAASSLSHLLSAAADLMRQREIDTMWEEDLD
jgi:hypothetical protein